MRNLLFVIIVAIVLVAWFSSGKDPDGVVVTVTTETPIVPPSYTFAAPTVPVLEPTSAPAILPPTVEPTWTPFYNPPTNAPAAIIIPPTQPAEPEKNGFEGGGGEIGTHDPGPSSRPPRKP